MVAGPSRERLFSAPRFWRLFRPLGVLFLFLCEPLVLSLAPFRVPKSCPRHCLSFFLLFLLFWPRQALRGLFGDPRVPTVVHFVPAVVHFEPRKYLQKHAWFCKYFLVAFGADIELLMAPDVVVSLPKTEAFLLKDAFDYWGLL